LVRGIKQWNFLERDATVSFYRKRQSDITTYYSIDGDLVYGNNIQELMEEFQFEHTSGQWRLFIYSSKVSLKTMLLHNENKLPSISLVDAVHVTETFRFSCKTYAMKNTGGINVTA